MSKQNLPEKNLFRNEVINDYLLEDEIGRGKNGVVYCSHHKDIIDLRTAIKLIPLKNLKDGWQIELKKVGLLDGITQVVQYKSHDAKILRGDPYAVIFWEFVEDDNLRKYAEQNPDNITLPFIEHLIKEVLTVFIAMKTRNSLHMVICMKEIF